ncbi:sensor histidine kinase [Neptuniibacter sp.]|uniref:sensor histidine kinase n=1 Tax=Neptuniibacter sp. TaxID=1962643 RepID=UPI00260AE49B|nr:sensor histidine kinase [Neptuniibacter sp.]MCP4597713.1 PAS domain-containing protein [Neptuniibacter sp.]
MFSLPSLILIGIAYLLFLFGAAYLTERNLLPKKLVHHPITHVLSIGVYASVWTFYGAFGLAQESGYSFLGSYFGAAITFILGPAILIPILRITRTYQLSSLADLFAFRFRSGGVGTFTAILSVLATLPMLSIQIQAVTDALYLLNDQFSADQIGLGFCFVIALFSILFGARHPTLRTSHRGLMVAMAVESLIKLAALLIIAGVAIFAILGGPSGVEAFLISNPESVKQLQTPIDSEAWRTLILAFFTGAIVMPHMFHMLFTENSSDETLYKATWMMPLFLFLLAAAVPPIMWAGEALNVGGDPQFLVLNLGLILDSSWLTVVAFIGGLSAASGIMIVATVSMASMLQNHVILPLVPKPKTRRFYSWLLWLRRVLIMAMLLASYLFYRQVGGGYDLHQMGIIAIVAFLQFLPGLLVTLFWQRATRWGLILGLLTGMGIWLFGMLIPTLSAETLGLVQFNLDSDNWDQIAVLSVLLNSAVLTVVSLLSTQSSDESQAAQACLMNALQKPSTSHLRVSRVSDFNDLLSFRLGKKAAEREVNKALEEMNLQAENIRPVDLLRLRTLLEHNLSGLLGPIEAATLLEPLDRPSDPMDFKASNVHMMENQLENYQEQLTGLAAELDEMRRYHRLTLQKLPTGVCTLDTEGQVIFWNSEMERLTGITATDIIGSRLGPQQNQWSEIIDQFSRSTLDHQLGQKLIIDEHTHWFSLHKSILKERRDIGMVILLEDESETKTMQDKLAHNERLASIGRFAAGVAHEIGNPVTGIACLAQNLKLETDNDYILETGDHIVDQTKRISRIVQSLVRFAHAGRPDADREQLPVSLAQCAAEAIHLLSLDSHGKQQNYVNNIPDALRINGDPQQIQQVFVNLLQNASDASEDGDSIWLEADENTETITLRVTDEGSGISEDSQERLFEPFFTTKDPGQGTGLGLSLVYNIIEEHYGSIEVISPANNKQKKGTQVAITLPRLKGSIES